MGLLWGAGSADSVRSRYHELTAPRYDQSDSDDDFRNFIHGVDQPANYRSDGSTHLAPLLTVNHVKNWFSPLITVPRYLESGIDPLTIGHDGGDGNSHFSRYVSSKGLVSYRRSSAGHSSINETLTLEPVTVAP